MSRPPLVRRLEGVVGGLGAHHLRSLGRRAVGGALLLLAQIAAIESDEVLVHPGSGSPAKNWPPRRFAEVIAALDAPVRLIVAEADLDAAAKVEPDIGRRLPRLEFPTLHELSRRLAGCVAYLGNDSGVSHLASLCGAHTVALFGPTDPDVWRPLDPDVRVLPFDAQAEHVIRLLIT